MAKGYFWMRQGGMAGLGLIWTGLAIAGGTELAPIDPITIKTLPDDAQQEIYRFLTYPDAVESYPVFRSRGVEKDKISKLLRLNEHQEIPINHRGNIESLPVREAFVFGHLYSAVKGPHLNSVGQMIHKIVTRKQGRKLWRKESINVGLSNGGLQPEYLKTISFSLSYQLGHWNKAKIQSIIEETSDPLEQRAKLSHHALALLMVAEVYISAGGIDAEEAAKLAAGGVGDTLAESLPGNVAEEDEDEHSRMWSNPGGQAWIAASASKWSNNPWYRAWLIVRKGAQRVAGNAAWDAARNARDPFERFRESSIPQRLAMATIKVRQNAEEIAVKETLKVFNQSKAEPLPLNWQAVGHVAYRVSERVVYRAYLKQLPDFLREIYGLVLEKYPLRPEVVIFNSKLRWQRFREEFFGRYKFNPVVSHFYEPWINEMERVVNLIDPQG